MWNSVRAFGAQNVHVSWMLMACSIGILLGTVFSLLYSGFGSLDWFVLSICVIAISLVRANYFKVLMIFAGGLLLGLARGGSEQISRIGLQEYIGEVAIVQGIVSDDPTISIDGDTRIVVSTTNINNQSELAELWVSIPQNGAVLPDVKRSDAVEVRGKIEQGFGTFEAAMYRAELTRIVRIPYSDVARDVRDDFASIVSSVVDQPESDLGNGFLLGTKSRLPEKLDQELRLLGLTHIVVASGYNLSILVRLSRRLFTKISRFTALASSVALVIAFAHVTGWSPSMTRAAMITLISLAAWYYGRRAHPFVLLSVVAAVTVLLKPSYAWGDIGWLLSFLAFGGVIILSPLLHLYFWGSQPKGVLRQILMETFSAQVMTAPLIIFVFGQYSPLALFANLLILPFIPLAMLFTFIAGVAGFISSGRFGEFLAWPAETLLRYMVAVVDWLATLPNAQREYSLSVTGLVVTYIGLAIFMVFLYKRTGHRLREFNIVE